MVHLPRRQSRSVSLVVLAGLLWAACGGGSWSYRVVGTQLDPGAGGELQVERIEGGNRMVTASLDHVTPASRLGDAMARYVMWFRDEDGRSTMASVLEYDEGSRSARATATTPMEQFEIVITAERAGSVAEPSDRVVFRQRVTPE